MRRSISKRRSVTSKAEVLKRLRPVADIVSQIEKLTRQGDEMLSDLIEDISWSTGDCVIGKRDGFDPPDYVFNVICNVQEGMFMDIPKDSDEDYAAWLKELMEELKPRRSARIPAK